MAVLDEVVPLEHGATQAAPCQPKFESDAPSKDRWTPSGSPHLQANASIVLKPIVDPSPPRSTAQLSTMTDVVNPPVDPLPAAPAVADPAPAADPAPVAAAEPAAAPVVPPAAAPAPVAPAEAAAPPAVTAPPVVAPPATTMPAIPASMPAMAPATMGLPAAGTVPAGDKPPGVLRLAVV